MKVFIPTAGIGSRLSFNTKYFNKSILPIGNIPVISHIIDGYPKSALFIIALGYKGDIIREYLKIAYPSHKFKFVNIKNYSGKNSSLTHTIKCSLRYLNSSFFFHANDTIVTDKKFYENIDTDTIFLNRKNLDNTKYRSASINSKTNSVEKIFNKSLVKIEKSLSYVGIAYIKDHQQFKNIISKSNDPSGEILYFLQKTRPTNYKVVREWFDIGDIESKNQAEIKFKKFNILPKVDQAIYFKDNSVIKLFADKKTINQRYKRSLVLKNIVPKINLKGKNFYKYDFINGNIFSSIKNIDTEFNDFLKWALKNLWKKRKLNLSQNEKFRNNCHNFYYEKTFNRINMIKSKNLLIDKVHKINNKICKPLEKILKKIDWIKICNGCPVNFHGDLHFENIIKSGSKSKYKLLDWRESFDNLINYGDIYYDFAKLNHGFIINHSLISENNFNVYIDKNKVNLSYTMSKKYESCQKILYKFIKDNNFSLYKVKIITALVYLNISPLHHYPYSNFLYYLGKYELQKTIEEYN